MLLWPFYVDRAETLFYRQRRDPDAPRCKVRNNGKGFSVYHPRNHLVMNTFGSLAKS